MTNRVLPFYKTGWFYLLLTLWLVSYWGTNSGSYNALNQFNITLLPTHQVSENSRLSNASSVVRIQADLTNAQYNNVERILKNTPDVAVLFIGSPSPIFMQRLESFQRTHKRRSAIIIATENFASRIVMNIEETSFFSPVLSWFRAIPLHTGQRLNARGLVYTPLLASQNNEFPVIWRTKDQAYLSVVGEVIRQVEQSNKFTLSQGWQLGITTDKYQRYFGFDGYIVSGASSPQAIAINKWSEVVSPQTQLIIIDGEHGTYGENISKIVTATLENDYLYQTLGVKFVEFFLFVAGVYLLWLSQQYIGKYLLTLLSGYVVLVFMLQWYLASNGLWLEVVPCVLVLYLTWAIWFAYQREAASILALNSRYNALLANSLTAKTTAKTLPEVLPLLSNIIPDEHLIEQLFQFAVKAESTNRDMAYQLYAWIDECGIGHQGTKNKMVLLRQQTQNPAINRAQNTKLPTAPVEQEKAQVEDKTQAAPQTQTRSIYQSPVTHAKSGLAYAMPTQTLSKPSRHVTDNISEQIADVEGELEQTVIIAPGQKAPNLAATGTFSVDKFGRYQVEGILGKGAMGIVYQGVDPRINRHVAIKTLQLNDAIDKDEAAEAKARFFKEAETAGNLSHANIVTIYDVGEEDSLGYIAMDLLTGAPLSHFIKQGNLLPTALVYQLMIQITDALEYAHNLNIVHRDIKPGNIIYDDDLQRVTVTDFGIAFVGDNSKTRTGVIMGSPYYMSPEQVLGKQVDGRSDIFSLGATFYQLLSGCLPFEGDSVVSVVYQITKEKHKPVNSRIEGLSPSALRITNKALHKDIDKRYQSMQEFKLALIAALKKEYKKAPII